MKRFPSFPILALPCSPLACPSVPNTRWQQEMDCTMDITMDVDVREYAGVMELTYINHSPDALDRIPFHLFFNAFGRKA